MKGNHKMEYGKGEMTMLPRMLCVSLFFIFHLSFFISLHAQGDTPDSMMMRQYFQMAHRRDLSSQHLYDIIPLSSTSSSSLDGGRGQVRSLPDDRVWFPGEWEEVQAVVVTLYYTYKPVQNPSQGYWTATPLLPGVAQYHQYVSGQWVDAGYGPYRATLETSSDLAKVPFYLIDAIQKGGAQAWVRVEQSGDTSIVARQLSQMGLRHDNIRFLVGPGNSIWYRDCGPICFYHGDQDSLAMLDFSYYPKRSIDDMLPTLIHQYTGIPNYQTSIKWEGGNCLVDGAGTLVSSDAVYEKNTDPYGHLTWDGIDPNTIEYTQVEPLSPQQVQQALHEIIGQRATHILPAYKYAGGTGHVDLYVDMRDENGFVFSLIPDMYSSWVDYQTNRQNIDSLCSYTSLFHRPYRQLGTIPFASGEGGQSFVSQEQYNNRYTRTYSNHTFVNNLIIQPCFSTVASDGMPTAAWDRANIQQVMQAYPGYDFYCVDVRSFDGSGGAIHCVTKQIPAENPLRILHESIHGCADAMQGQEVPVSAVITNRSGISHAEVVYRVDGGQWQTISLTANDNRWYGRFPALSLTETAADSTLTVEYYISATSNNGKTLTKPITASQGGYYSYYYTASPDTDVIDGWPLTADTLPMPLDSITFTFGENWLHQDQDQLPVDPCHPTAEAWTLGQFHPNPASGRSSVTVDISRGTHCSVIIFDCMGRTLQRAELKCGGQTTYTLDTNALPHGVYTVVFSDGNHRAVRKLVVR